MSSHSGDPEHRLSSALRAQASGTSQPAVPSGTTSGRFGRRPAPAARLPVLRVLLFALVLGLLAGVVAGALTLI